MALTGPMDEINSGILEEASDVAILDCAAACGNEFAKEGCVCRSIGFAWSVGRNRQFCCCKGVLMKAEELTCLVTNPLLVRIIVESRNSCCLRCRQYYEKRKINADFGKKGKEILVESLRN